MFADHNEVVKKRYNFRAYPDAEAQINARRLFGCVRLVKNRFLAERLHLRALGLHDLVPLEVTARQVTTLLKQDPDYAFLAEVAAAPLQQGVEDKKAAYKNWWNSLNGKRKGRKMGAPRFERRSNRQTARFTRNTKFKVHAPAGSKWGWVEMTGVGRVKFRLTRPIPGVTTGLADTQRPGLPWMAGRATKEDGAPTSVTLITNPDGTWEVSFVVESPRKAPTPLAHPGRIAAIDAGLTHLATIVYCDPATGEMSREKIDNPHYLKQALSRLRREQRELSRRTKTVDERRQPDGTIAPQSANREKSRLRVAKTHARVTAMRTDHHRKLAARLATENEVVIREDLCLHGMGRTRLSKSVYDTAIGTLFDFIADAMKNRTTSTTGTGETQTGATTTHQAAADPESLHVIGRWVPTSQPCSLCGINQGRKPLSVREWTCDPNHPTSPGCGARHDRDYNAAINMLLLYLATLTQTAALSSEVAAGLARPDDQHHRGAGRNGKDAPTRGGETLNACGLDVRRPSVVATEASPNREEAGTALTATSPTTAA